MAGTDDCPALLLAAQTGPGTVPACQRAEPREQRGGGDRGLFASRETGHHLRGGS